MAPQSDIFAGELLDETAEYDLDELCRICRLERAQVVDFVVQSVVEPAGDKPEHWRFSGTAVTRVQVATRLRRDLGVNTAGAALALELLDEIERLRRRVREPG